MPARLRETRATVNAPTSIALTKNHMLRLRLSKLGLTLVLVFLLAAATLFAIHLHAFAVNPEQPGEGALLFFLFTLPWALVLPGWLVAEPWWSGVLYYVGWIFICFNALLLYCLSGGLALGRGDASGDPALRRDMRPDPHVVRDG
jgi:hypothetical protein